MDRRSAILRAILRTSGALCAVLAAPVAAGETAADPPTAPLSPPAAEQAGTPFTAQDELVLELQIEGANRRDTIIAYGRLPEVYLPFGLISRLLDLAISTSPDGRHASGWILSETRTLSLTAGQGFAVLEGREIAIDEEAVVGFDGELYVRPSVLELILPVEVEVDLRAQSVAIATLEVFPFQARQCRDGRRGLLESQGTANDVTEFPRAHTPYLLASMPKADLELRAMSDQIRGERLEGELYFAGDLATASAEILLAAASNDGLTAALMEIGRDNPDGGMLGPLDATSFALGDIQTVQQPVGLRNSFGRGFRISNAALDTQSVFDEIDLRGVLQDGYEVELYRNGVLLGSTARAVNGQYEFLGVPVDFGINAFRLVFYGPQGQQREEVRTIRVGDGRVRKGELVYDLGVVQNERTVLDVRREGAIVPPYAGGWRAIAKASYGLSQSLTTVASASFDEEAVNGQELAGTIGLRTGFGSTGLRFDAAFASGGGRAFVGGLNGRFGNTNFTVNHGEYSGGFVDELLAPGRRALSRATDVNLSTSLDLSEQLFVPVVARARRIEYDDGAFENRVGLRGSIRKGDFLFSNSAEYVSFETAEGFEAEQAIGVFDLTAARGENTRVRASFEYEILPTLEPNAVSLVADRNFGEHFLLQAGAGYRFDGSSLTTSASVLTRLGKTTLALEADYDFRRKSHAVALRWGLSFGRSSRGFYVDHLSRARLGAVEVRAFHDRNADGVRNEDEAIFPDLAFFSPSETVLTDDRGYAMITGLPEHRPTKIQLDMATLPDITLVPAEPGLEIVPRRGRTHSAEFAIVSVGEVEGTVVFVSGSDEQAVGGVRLGLKPLDTEGETRWLRSETDGYAYFEQVRPGRYAIVLDPEQAKGLGICLIEDSESLIEVEPEGGAYAFSARISRCPLLATAND